METGERREGAKQGKKKGTRQGGGRMTMVLSRTSLRDGQSGQLHKLVQGKGAAGH